MLRTMAVRCQWVVADFAAAAAAAVYNCCMQNVWRARTREKNQIKMAMMTI